MTNKIIETQNKIRSNINLKRERKEKYTSPSNTSVMSPDSFWMAANDYQSDVTSVFDFSKSTVKIKKKK